MNTVEHLEPVNAYVSNSKLPTSVVRSNSSSTSGDEGQAALGAHQQEEQWMSMKKMGSVAASGGNADAGGRTSGASSLDPSGDPKSGNTQDGSQQRGKLPISSSSSSSSAPAGASSSASASASTPSSTPTPTPTPSGAGASAGAGASGARAAGAAAPSAEAMASADAETAEWLADFRQIEEITVDPSTSDLLVRVPSDQVGRMIGKSGQVIRDLQAQSGAFINMGKDGDVHRVARISGNYPETYLCSLLLVQKFTPREQTSKHAKLEEMARFCRRNRAMPHVEETFAVPEEFLGRVIGKGGQALREMQELSHARIELPKTSPAGPEHHRMVLISGSPEEVAHCRELLTARITPREDGSSTSSNSDTHQPQQQQHAHHGEASPAGSSASSGAHSHESHARSSTSSGVSDLSSTSGMRPYSQHMPSYYGGPYAGHMSYYPHITYPEHMYYMSPYGYMPSYQPYPGAYPVADLSADMSHLSMSPSTDAQDDAQHASVPFGTAAAAALSHPHSAYPHPHAHMHPPMSMSGGRMMPPAAHATLPLPLPVGAGAGGPAGGPGAMGGSMYMGHRRAAPLHAMAPLFVPGYPAHRQHESIVPIPAELVGRLIGRQGAAVKQLQMETRTRVDVLDPEPNATDSTRYVRITALVPENVRLCEAHIRNRVAQHYGSFY